MIYVLWLTGNVARGTRGAVEMALCSSLSCDYSRASTWRFYLVRRWSAMHLFPAKLHLQYGWALGLKFWCTLLKFPWNAGDELVSLSLKIQGSVCSSVTYCDTCLESPGSVPRDRWPGEVLRTQDNVTEPRLTCGGEDKGSRQSLGLGFRLGLCAGRYRSGMEGIGSCEEAHGHLSHTDKAWNTGQMQVCWWKSRTPVAALCIQVGRPGTGCGRDWVLCLQSRAGRRQGGCRCSTHKTLSFRFGCSSAPGWIFFFLSFVSPDNL